MQEVAIQARPGETATSTFKLSNTGTADLSYNLTASAPSGLATASSHAASMSGLTSSELPTLPAFDLKTTQSVKVVTPVLYAEAAAAPTSPDVAASTDVLMLDDGNNTADDFIGEGPNSFNKFYWMNQFDLAQDFLLEGLQVYMRTETQTSNVVEVAIMDNNLDDLLRTDVNMTLASSGGWYTITFTNPVRFKTGDTFYIELGASAAIAYPAGADKNAQVQNRSFHYNWVTNDYEEIGAVTGFERGAYLIRALGTKSGGGTNQPPVARRQFSKTLAQVGETITFDASQSSDPDGQIVQYLWEFGDNSTSNQKITTHAYARAGNFSPKLTVTDDKGATGQAIGFITISPGSTSRLAVNPISGTVAPGGTQTINIAFDARDLAEGNYQGQIDITSNGGNRTIPVRIRVSNTTGVDGNSVDLPHALELAQNYPNPFNPETGIRYELPHDGNVMLAVFDLNGRRIALLESGLKTAGQHFVRWDGHDSDGNRVTSGIYFYRLEATSPDGTAAILTKKMTVMK